MSVNAQPVTDDPRTISSDAHAAMRDVVDDVAHDVRDVRDVHAAYDAAAALPHGALAINPYPFPDPRTIPFNPYDSNTVPIDRRHFPHDDDDYYAADDDDAYTVVPSPLYPRSANHSRVLATRPSHPRSLAVSYATAFDSVPALPDFAVHDLSLHHLPLDDDAPDLLRLPPKARFLASKPSHARSLAASYTTAFDSAPALPSFKPDDEKPKPESLAEDPKSDVLGPPPDGGLDAWLTVLGASLVAFSTFGVVNAYGAFNDFYRRDYLSNYSPTLVSMIGSIQVFVLYVIAAVVGPIFDAFGPRYMIPASGLVTTFALLMLSIVQPHQIYQQFLSQSVLFNLGAAFGYLPSMSIITHWFQKRTAYALGIVLGSASLGGIVIPIMMNQLIPRIGFGWTVRIMALMTFASYTIASVTIRARRPRRPLPPLSRLIDVRAFRDARYAIFAAGAWLTIVSVFNPFFQVGAYGVAAHGRNPLTPYLLAIMCATSIAGRVLPGLIADRAGRFNTICVATTASAVLTLTLWYTSTAEANVVAFAALYGFASGPFFSLLPACVAQISPADRVGARIGMLFATLSFGALAGTPVGGVFIRESTVANFRHLILYTGCLGLAGSALLIAARFKCDKRLRAVV